MSEKNESKIEKDLEARRAELKVKRDENAQEKRRIANIRREEKIKDAEVKRKIREQKGGMGVTLVFYEKAMPKKTAKRKSREVAMSKSRRGKR